jgi:hypothetical protein
VFDRRLLITGIVGFIVSMLGYVTPARRNRNLRKHWLAGLCAASAMIGLPRSLCMQCWLRNVEVCGNQGSRMS